MTGLRRAALAVALAVVAASCASGRPSPAESAALERAYLRDGSRAFLARDFPAAVDLYARALELERQQPSLPRNDWRTLVDNLGVAYGISGQLERSRETFAYGLSKDPEYPMFHYNLACAHAELGERDAAIAELELAFRYEANMIEGETMPDPRNDPSFARYLLDDAFNRALQRIEAR